MNASLPIGVFDSGVGGLTVLRALRAQHRDRDRGYGARRRLSARHCGAGAGRGGHAARPPAVRGAGRGGLDRRSLAEAITRRCLGPLFAGPQAPDALLLGCTHFPVSGGPIRRAEGDGVAVIDSAQTTATAVAGLLTQAGLARPQGPGRVQLLATDSPERFAAVGAVFSGAPIAQGEVELVDL